MKMRNFGKLGIQGSALGFGCMRFNGPDGKPDHEKAIKMLRHAIDSGLTYLDTAYVYLDKTSEIIVGEALQDGYRDKVTIATKLPLDYVKCPEDMDRILNEELGKLQTDHIDFYLAHGINREKWDRFKELGLPEYFKKWKAEGKVRYACFSFHGPYEDFEYIINDYDWDMTQIQFNYMDIENQAGLKGLKLAGSLGIPVVIMEGLLGGRLAKAPDNVQALYDAFPVKRSAVEWAERWLCNFPEVATVLSGMNEPEQLEENLKIFDTVEAGIMSGDELKLIDDVRAAYISRTKVNCTGCRYCMPCPNGVQIPNIFSVWNNASLYDEDPKKNHEYKRIMEQNGGPENCLSCGACEAACPQHLNIIEMLQAAKEALA